jgi:hypothetical protein
MKNMKIIQLLVLFSMFFNISHASLIALADDCEHAHETLTLVLDDSEHNDCDDLCDIHHLFHFMAILITPDTSFNHIDYKEVLSLKAIYYTPPFKQTTIKPPIA